MAKYIFKRIIISIFTLWVMYTIVFFIMHALPGGPMLGEHQLPPQIQQARIAKYGLDKPLPDQYLLYTANLLHGDLGMSITQQTMSVNEIISTYFPVSASIGFLSIVVSLLLGLLLGVGAAIKRNSLFDRVTMIIVTLGIAVPSFVLATVGLVVFSLKLNWLPGSGLDTPLNYIMPVFALSMFSISTITRLTRSSMLDVLHQDYIRTAKAKGLKQGIVLFKHALRNAILPVITYMAPLAAGVITGSFVIESIFSIPGLGAYFVTSISVKDYPVVLGVTLFYGALIIAFNFLADIAYVFVDPRIKLSS
jgi:ABC-type dipeptide/oligopeptide/nickel transport system permease component